MSCLSFQTIPIPGAALGPENPLPALRGETCAAPAPAGPSIPPDMARRMEYGRVRTILPYALQDGYDRSLLPRPARVAVLENETLRAVFLLEWGGRLASLLHKPSGRELLSVNPVLRPANLALRNAWCSGGVEWNIGTIGHGPFTCAPLFAAAVPGAEPVLRLWEWERIRGTPFQIDCSLPDGSPVLLVHVRVSNPNAGPVPMYWWSNIAAPEAPGARVLAPAATAYVRGRGGVAAEVPVPRDGGRDVSYPTSADHADDWFFNVPDGERRWICAVDGRGAGLAQASTDLLQGRKLFVWGMHPGGRAWQSFLTSAGAGPYLEIQAGLARTQMEHLSMPAGAVWSWTEAYGCLELDPAEAHARDWDRAVGAAAAAVERLIPRELLEKRHAAAAVHAQVPPEAPVQRGSGWGALERLRRQAAGEPALAGPGTPFDDDSLGPAQAPWIELLRGGGFGVTGGVGLDEAPRFADSRGWRVLLDAFCADRGDGAGAEAWHHLGVMRASDGEREAARQAWRRSIGLERLPGALYALAVLAAEDGDADAAETLLVEACRALPGLKAAAAACGTLLLRIGRPRAWLAVLEGLAAEVRAAGRIRLLEGRAALDAGDLPLVAAILEAAPVVDDIREGEVSLSDLWTRYHEERLCRETGRALDEELRARVRREHPVPAALDFRVS
jgi:hypothetical protein